MKNIKIKLDTMEFEELRSFMTWIQYTAERKIETIYDAYCFECVLTMRMRLNLISTIYKNVISFTVSIVEATILWHLSQYDYQSPLTNSVMVTIRTQIEKKGERYIAEMQDLKKRVKN